MSFKLTPRQVTFDTRSLRIKAMACPMGAAHYALPQEGLEGILGEDSMSLTKPQQAVMEFFEQDPIGPRTLHELTQYDTSKADGYARVIQRLIDDGYLSGWAILPDDHFWLDAGQGPMRVRYYRAPLVPTTPKAIEQFHVDLDQDHKAPAEVQRLCAGIAIWASNRLYIGPAEGDLHRLLERALEQTDYLNYRVRTWLGLLLSQPDGVSYLGLGFRGGWHVGRYLDWWPRFGMGLDTALGRIDVQARSMPTAGPSVASWQVVDDVDGVVNRCRDVIWSGSLRR